MRYLIGITKATELESRYMTVQLPWSVKEKMKTVAVLLTSPRDQLHSESHFHQGPNDASQLFYKITALIHFMSPHDKASFLIPTIMPLSFKSTAKSIRYKHLNCTAHSVTSNFTTRQLKAVTRK